MENRTMFDSDTEMHSHDDDSEMKFIEQKPTYAPLSSKKDCAKTKSQRFSSSTMDRATKRVIAPYVRIIRKGEKLAKAEKEEECTQFRYYLDRKPSLLMKNLSAFLSDSVDLPSVLHETVDVLKSVTNAFAATLYIVDAAANEIFQSPRNVISCRHKVNWKIQPDKTIAAYVAYKKEYVMVDDILGDPRFPEGAGYQDETIKSILCIPVVSPNNDCYAVIELCRDVTQPNFGRDDLKIVVVVTGWMGAAIHQNQQRITLQKQQELNDYLLDLIKCYFADTVGLDKVISEIMSFAKTTLGAERGAIYVIDKNSEDLETTVFEQSIDDEEEKFQRKNLKIKLAHDMGIVGLVARNCETVNLTDACNDPRFTKEVDEKTGSIMRSVLCMPIMGVSGILGVVQLINKQNNITFTEADENLLSTFSVYCSLALHYNSLNTLMYKTDKTNKCLQNVLHYHMKPCPHDSYDFQVNPYLEDYPADFDEFSWYISSELQPVVPQLVLYMMLETLGEADFEVNVAMEFVLTVQKSYRNNPYHSFEHAFSVCHCMYNVVKRNRDRFTDIELKALMISALCHDVDHRGYTNNFLQLTNDTLAQLYDESYLENHHYVVTMMILNNTKLLKVMSEADFKQLSKEIEHLILATDLATYFRCRTKLIQTWHDHPFDWDNVKQRSLVKSLIMTVVDLSGQCKPYATAKNITAGLYREFYNQGDIEKDMGLYPLSMMDRDKQHLIPEDQTQFLNVVVIPCVELVCVAFSNLEELLTESKSLKESWKQIIDLRNQKCWKQSDSVVEKV